MKYTAVATKNMFEELITQENDNVPCYVKKENQSVYVGDFS